MAITSPIGGRLGLGVAGVARALARGLGPGDGGPVLALGDDLGRALRRLGLEVRAVGPARRGRRREWDPAPVAATLAEVDPALEGGAALLARAVAPDEVVALLEQAAPRLRDGGLVVLAAPAAGLWQRRPRREALAAAFLHGALIDVEQRVVSSIAGPRLLLTSGRVRHAARGAPGV